MSTRGRRNAPQEVVASLLVRGKHESLEGEERAARQMLCGKRGYLHVDARDEHGNAEQGTAQRTPHNSIDVVKAYAAHCLRNIGIAGLVQKARLHELGANGQHVNARAAQLEVEHARELEHERLRGGVYREVRLGNGARNGCNVYYPRTGCHVAKCQRAHLYHRAAVELHHSR